MSTTRRNYRFNLMGTLVVSALSLFALAFPLSPAKAQCFGVDLGFGCAGLGVGSWYSRPYYYGNPYYYGPTYYVKPSPTYYVKPSPTYYVEPSPTYYVEPNPTYHVEPGYSYSPAGRPDYEHE